MKHIKLYELFTFTFPIMIAPKNNRGNKQMKSKKIFHVAFFEFYQNPNLSLKGL